MLIAKLLAGPDVCAKHKKRVVSRVCMCVGVEGKENLSPTTMENQNSHFIRP